MSPSLLPILFATAAITIQSAPPRTSSEPARVSMLDWLHRIYPDTPLPVDDVHEFALESPRGSVAAVHLLLRNLPPAGEISWQGTRDGEATTELRCYELLDVPVDFNTGLHGWTEARDDEQNPFVLRDAPFRTYDAIRPVGSPLIVPAPSMVLRLESPIPAAAAPGKREYRIRLAIGEIEHELAFTVHVRSVTVPPVGSESFPYTNWLNFRHAARWGEVEPWSEEHFALLARYAKTLHERRQNTFLIHLHDVFATTPGGPPELDRERLRRLVDSFDSAGMHWIEGGHLAGRENGEWTAERFTLTVAGIRASTPDGNRALAHMCAQLMDEIQANGWQDRWLQHVADEPIPANATDYRFVVGMVRKYMPGIPILDATMDTDLAGTVDIWCPQLHVLQQNAEAFESQRAVGDRIWGYTCLHPGGPWLNRLLDQELLRPLLIGWGAARFRLDGFLHWGGNWWTADPFTIGNKQHGGTTDKTRLPAGDTHILYPGEPGPGGGPWSSLRLEAHRQGFEDLELLTRLRARDAPAAGAIIERMLRGFDDYSVDVAEYRAARKLLLDALEE